MLESHSIEQSMSRAGNCYDDAMMERLWSIRKKEFVHDCRFRTRASRAARLARVAGRE